MLIGTVIHYEIEDDADVSFSRLTRHSVEVGQRSIHGIDVLVVGDVVSEVHLRRRKAGRNPDGINPQILQIVEFRGNALQITQTVVVAIFKAARIDLVEHCVLPPLMTFGVHCLV